MEMPALLKQIMTHSEYNHIVETLNGVLPEQMRQLRREMDGKLAASATRQSAEHDLGSIGAKWGNAEFLGEIVANATKARQEQPWSLLSPLQHRGFLLE